MKIAEFYDVVDGIVLYPGTLDELNRNEQLLCSGKRYDLVPLEGSMPFLKGVLMTDRESWDESEKKGVKGFLCPYFGKRNSQEDFDRAHPENDIRYNAANLGADGIIQFRSLKEENGYSQSYPVYAGLPVRDIRKKGAVRRQKPFEPVNPGRL